MAEADRENEKVKEKASLFEVENDELRALVKKYEYQVKYLLDKDTDEFIAKLRVSTTPKEFPEILSGSGAFQPNQSINQSSMTPKGHRESRFSPVKDHYLQKAIQGSKSHRDLCNFL